MGGLGLVERRKKERRKGKKEEEKEGEKEEEGLSFLSGF